MMSTIHLWVITSTLTLQIGGSQPQNYRPQLHTNAIVREDPIKNKALSILQNKCNVCHKKRNPFMIFKPKNMERRSKRIYKQVFVKKRMPKGDDIKLTDLEYKQLLTWIESTKK